MDSSNKLKLQSTLSGHSEEVFSVAWSMDGTLASGSGDNSVKVWVMDSSNKFKLQSTLTGHSDYVRSVAWSNDGKLASGSYDRTIRIWSEDSSGTFNCQSTLSGHSRLVTSVAWSKDGTLVSASEDGTTRFWDVATGAQKEEMQGEKCIFTKSPSDQHLAGKYVVTKQGDLLLVHLIDTAIASANEKAEQNKKPVAFFRAPASIQTLECAGDKIAVGCENGEVLHLRAAFLLG